MTTNIATICDYLDRGKMQYILEEEQILIGMEYASEKLILGIELKDDGNIVQIGAFDLFCVKDHLFKGVIFQTILKIMFENNLIYFCYDADRGMISAFSEIPIFDSSLTEYQLWSILELFLHHLSIALPRLRHVLATGDDPGREWATDRAIICALVAELPDELVAMFKEVLAKRSK